jgi:hypothetical protein
MLLLPREIWDQVSVESLKNDVLQVLEGKPMGSSFHDLTDAHKYNPDAKLYCVRQFISLYLKPIVLRCHSMDFNHVWETSPWSFFMARHVTPYQDPIAISLLERFSSSIFLGPLKNYFQSVWDEATDCWVMSMPKERNMMWRLHNMYFMDQLERRLTLFPQYINWINPWNMWISEDIHISTEQIGQFKEWMIYHQVFPMEEDVDSDSSHSFVGIEDFS